MSDLLKCYLRGTIVKADLELFKDTFAAKKDKANSKAFRDSYWCINLPLTYLNLKIMDICRDKASVAYYNHLQSAFVPINSQPGSFCCTDDAESGPGIYKHPDTRIKQSNRNDGHHNALMQDIRKFYNRHTISSSRGIRMTEGILSGAIARAFSSTSLRESPTATRASLTTATYFPAYLVTSSLKCSTIQRSSLSILNPPFDLKSKHSIKTITPLRTVSQDQLGRKEEKGDRINLLSKDEENRVLKYMVVRGGINRPLIPQV